MVRDGDGRWVGKRGGGGQNKSEGGGAQIDGPVLKLQGGDDNATTCRVGRESEIAGDSNTAIGDDTVRLGSAGRGDSARNLKRRHEITGLRRAAVGQGEGQHDGLARI